MAIRTRRGNSADFDPDKLVSGEPATVTDNGKIKWCVSPGNVKTIATIEDMTDAITEANQPIIEQLTDGANAVANVVEGVLDGVNHVIDSNGTAYKIGMDNGELFLEELEEDTSEPASSRILQDIEDLQNNKINKTSIVQNTSVSDTDKVPSAAVTNSLQRQINEQNNNLANIFAAANDIATSIDDKNLPLGLHFTSTNTPGTFPSGATKAGIIICLKRKDSHIAQIYIEHVTGMFAVRYSDDTTNTWNAWSIK